MDSKKIKKPKRWQKRVIIVSFVLIVTFLYISFFRSNDILINILVIGVIGSIAVWLFGHLGKRVR